MTHSEASTTSDRRLGVLRGRGLLTAFMVGAFLWSLTTVGWGGSLLHPGGLASLAEFLRAALTPELSPPFLRLTLESAWTTVAYAVAGICLAVIMGLAFGIPASGVLFRSAGLRVPAVGGLRFTLAFMRAIHELVWAWFFVVAVGLSPMAAVMALAIPYGGILGRVYADILNDVPEQPLRALRTAGASELKVLVYGRMPMALPDMLGYSFYRLECAIRAVAIMGFVGIGGLGLQVHLSLDDLFYGEVWTLLYAIIGLVALVDAWSSWVRRSLTS
jgi:phosphonate transport system permease protein